MKRNNKGLVLPELLAILAFILLIFAFGGYAAFKNGDKRKYEVFAQNARDFGTKATTYKVERVKNYNEVYLIDLVNDHYIKAYKNPFSGGGDCDLHESKVVFFSDGSKRVTLKCGDYLVDSQMWSSGNYKVYKVSSWQEKIGDSLEAETSRLYKYKKNGIEMLDDYVVTKKLVTTYNSQERKNIRDIDQINDENIEIISKMFYRTKKLVKENL